MGQYNSITAEDKRVLREKWAIVLADFQGFRQAIFTTIYTDYPSMASYFPYAGTGDERFQKHTKKIMLTLDNWMQLIDEPERLQAAIVATGARHAKRNIEPEQFINVRKGFVRALAGKIGPKHFNEKEQRAFEKVLTYACNEIIVACDRERTRRGMIMF